MFYEKARRVVIAVVGSTVVLVGVALIVLPGPAFVVIPAGLAILALEFAWAARLLKSVKQQAHKIFKTGKAGEADQAPTERMEPPASSTLPYDHPQSTCSKGTP